jgi:calcineurin-like phosphoesterase family protein
MKKPSNRIFVTSDTFFGRKKTATSRGFRSAEEMDEAMIEKWNAKVGESDIVIHLGNFAWSVNVADDVIDKLNGSILFMIGEKDQALVQLAEHDESINVIKDHILMQDDVVFCHYPMEIWPGKSLKKYHFHGHIESNLKTDLKKMLRVNVCCDNWSLAPISVQDTLDLLKDFQ